jgi:putative thioredoxin
MKSYEKPVMVDFWAPWCGPCHMLSPIIERVVQSLGGKVLLAKLNVDENPVTASRYGVMGIPTVALFVKGKPVDRFVGALPEGAILKWLSKWIS